MAKKFKILTDKYISLYTKNLENSLPKYIKKLTTRDGYSKSDFEHYLQASSVYSSNIEGNSVDIGTYFRNKKFKIRSKKKEMTEIDDLIVAYNFAMNNKLTKTNLLKAHGLLSKHLLDLKSERGAVRKKNIGIVTNEDITEYIAIDYIGVKKEFNKLLSDIDELLNQKLSDKEVFYYASLIHLIFEKIHPFMDGNGRTGRLLEKWFLSEKIGKGAWSIPSEQYYAINKSEYYKKIHIGVVYEEIDLDRCVPFLLMLTDSLEYLD